MDKVGRKLEKENISFSSLLLSVLLLF